MIRSRSSIKTVADVSAQREREAALELALGCKRLSKQLEQLEQLQAFREEYAGQAHERAMSGASAHNWQLYADFLEGIDDVIVRQERDLEQTHTLIKNKRGSWRKASQRSTIINEVVERVDRYLKRRIQRREQNEVDDQSFRARRR